MSDQTEKVREEEVRFRNGAVTLAGTLVLPKSIGPHPAVVFTHGAGPETRKNTLAFAKALVRHGIAGLVYDKRGVGESTGFLPDVILSFEDLVGDALAAIRFLQARDDINREQIGLEGGSQGAWIISIAASRSTDVAFIMALSGAGVSPHRQMLYFLGNQLRKDGVSKLKTLTDIASRKLVAGLIRIVYLGRSRAIRPGLTDESPPSRLALGVRSVQAWAAIVHHDPGVTFEQVQCPVLALFGERDTVVPVEESIRVLEDAMHRGGNTDLTIETYPKADHRLRSSDAPGLIDTVVDWLLERVTVRS